MAYTIIDWIFEKVEEELTKKEDFSEKVKSIAEEEITTKGDKRLKNYLGRLFDDTSPQGRNFSDIIDKNNSEWIQTQLTDINNARDRDDLGVVKDRVDAGSYEDESNEIVETALGIRLDEFVRPVVPPEEKLKPRQVENLSDILGIPEREVRDLGIRAAQQALEGELSEQIDSATTNEELDEIEENLEFVPTKSAIKRLRKDIKEKRKEIRGE